MVRILNSFKIRFGNKLFDYRLSENLDLDQVKNFFHKKYQIKKLWQGPRHILGILLKNNKSYFLKLSTSEGISIVTKNEYYWNNYFNNYSLNPKYLVPKNYDSGLFKKKYFYLITEYFNGKLLCETRDCESISDLVEFIPQIIDLSELIQQLPQSDFLYKGDEKEDFQMKFLSKTRSWFNDIPSDVAERFNIKILWKIVEGGIARLSSRPRHGDFAPWHMVKLPGDRLGLIDGEHAMPYGVEGYDICYFIQRVFSVLERPDIAESIFLKLKDKGYKTSRLKVVLAARAIGGFLDESLTDRPDYKYADNFKDWVKSLP